MQTTQHAINFFWQFSKDNSQKNWSWQKLSQIRVKTGFSYRKLIGEHDAAVSCVLSGRQMWFPVVIGLSDFLKIAKMTIPNRFFYFFVTNIVSNVFKQYKIYFSNISSRKLVCLMENAKKIGTAQLRVWLDQ